MKYPTAPTKRRKKGDDLSEDLKLLIHNEQQNDKRH